MKQAAPLVFSSAPATSPTCYAHHPIMEVTDQVADLHLHHDRITQQQRTNAQLRYTPEPRTNLNRMTEANVTHKETTQQQLQMATQVAHSKACRFNLRQHQKQGIFIMLQSLKGAGCSTRQVALRETTVLDAYLAIDRCYPKITKHWQAKLLCHGRLDYKPTSTRIKHHPTSLLAVDVTLSQNMTTSCLPDLHSTIQQC